jgi:hypothetical protein
MAFALLGKCKHGIETAEAVCEADYRVYLGRKTA